MKAFQRIARTAIAALAGGALLAAVGCGGDSESPAPAAKPEPAAPAQPEPAPEPEPEPQPAAAAEPEAAAPGAAVDLSAADVEAGKADYQLYCATCHGAAGAGDGPLAPTLDPKPAHHNDGSYMNPLSNEHLFKVIKEGGQAVGKSAMMAPWGGTLSDAQIVDVIAFIRTLAVPPYEP